MDSYLLDTDPAENALTSYVKAGKLSTTLLMIGFRNYRDIYTKTRQYVEQGNKFALFDGSGSLTYFLKSLCSNHRLINV